MKFVTRKLILIILLFWSYSSHAEWLEKHLREALKSSGYEVPKKVNQKFDVKKSKVGELVFKSNLFSFNSNTTCQTCHLDNRSSADGLPNAVGVGGHGEGMERINSDGKIVPRNTLPLWGRGGKDFNAFFWDGKVAKIYQNIISQMGEDLPTNDMLNIAVHLPFVEIREMIEDSQEVSKTFKNESVNASKQLQNILLERVKNDKEFSKLFSNAYNIQIKDLKFIHITDSVVHHIRNKFRLRETKLSKFFEGHSNLTNDEIKGGIIFFGKGKCANCHYGPHFSDFKYHRIVTPLIGFGKNGYGIDYGRFNVTLDYDDLYKFRTPPLANVDKTSPYGHSGSINSLKKVIQTHYDPLSLINIDNLDDLRRRELFKIIASIDNIENIPSYLDDQELDYLQKFLKTLSF